MDKFGRTVIIILLLIIVGGAVYYSHKVDKLEKAVQDSIEYVVDTLDTNPQLIYVDSAKVSKKDGVLVPKIIYTDTGSVHTIYDTIREVDTIEVLVDYYSLKTYMDSIVSEDVQVKVFDTLQKNRIFARKYMITNYRTEDFYKTRKVFIGGTVGGNANSFAIGPTLSYADKKNNLFSGSYLISPDNKSFSFSYQKKISLKRRK